MQTDLIHDGPQRTFAIVLEPGDEAIECLEKTAADLQLSVSRFTGLGAFSDAVLGYFSWVEKEYEEIPITESPAHLERRHDPKSGLGLIHP